MLMLTVSALITSYETVGDHTEFVTQVSCNGEVWLVSRRFSDFDQLHSRLVSRFGDLIEARLPEKQWFGRFDPNFLAKRQVSLQAYLESLLLTPGILEDRSLQHFLDLEKRVDWSGDLAAGGIGSNGRPSGSFPSKSVTLNETDRLSAIVENAGLAFIDISEVPEPLEAEQAVQRKNEIAAAAQTLLSASHVAAHFGAQLAVLQLPRAAAPATVDEVVARLESSSDDSATLEREQALLLATLERVEASLALTPAAPSSELLAVMELSLTPAATSSAAATTSRSSLSGALDNALEGGDASLSASFH